MGKLKDKLKQKLVEAQVGASIIRMGLDVKKAQHKEKVFASMKDGSKRTGELTVQHFGALIPVVIMFVIGFWWTPIRYVGLGMYVLYNISTYRKIDCEVK